MNTLESIAALDSPDESTRSGAAEDLGYANCAEAVGPLVAHLRVEASLAVREAILAALDRMDSPTLAQEVVPLLESKDAWIRNRAIPILRKRAAAILPVIQDILAGGERHVRKLALDILRGENVPGSEIVYAQALKDPDLNVLITAIENVGLSGDVRFRDEILRLGLEAKHPMLAAACMDCLTRIGDLASARSMLAAYRGRVHKSKSVAWPLVRLLGAHGSLVEADHLVDLLAEPDGAAHDQILAGLLGIQNRHGPLEMTARLAGLLESSFNSGGDLSVTYWTLEFLLPHAGNAAFAGFFERGLCHPEPLVRVCAARGALRSGSVALREAVIHCCQSEKDPDTRRALEECLLHAGNK